MQFQGLEEFNSALIATVSGLFVGSIIKFFNKVLDRKKDEFEQHVTLRKELREELDVVKSELHSLQKELDEWKEKYYHQVQLTNSLKLDVLTLTEELTEYKRISGIHHSSQIITNNGWFDATADDSK